MQAFTPFTVLLPDGTHTRFDCQSLVMQETSPEKKTIMETVFGALPSGSQIHYAAVVKRGQCVGSVTEDEFNGAQEQDQSSPASDAEIVEQPKMHWATKKRLDAEAAKALQGA